MVIDKMMIGGAEQVFEDLVLLLKSKIDLTALFINNSELEQATRINSHIPVIELNRKNKYSILKMIKCAIVLRKYDVVHVHMRHTYRYVALINKLFNLRKNLILHDHYGLIEIDQRAPFSFAKYFAPYYYIGVSESLKNWSIDAFDMSLDMTSTLVNLPPKSIKFKDNIEIEKSSNSLVIVGNIKEVKNQRFAIEFAERIGQKIDVIGKIKDNKYFSSLNISDGNFIHDMDDVTENLVVYKFGLCTSISESGPLVLLEYLVAGLPFIAYRTGGIAEILARYFPEYFIDSFELKDWVKCYENLKENYSRIDKNQIDYIINKEFNKSVYEEKLLAIYQKCLIKN